MPIGTSFPKFFGSVLMIGSSEDRLDFSSIERLGNYLRGRESGGEDCDRSARRVKRGITAKDIGQGVFAATRMHVGFVKYRTKRLNFPSFFPRRRYNENIKVFYL